jgi:hypothetical protein
MASPANSGGRDAMPANGELSSLLGREDEAMEAGELEPEPEVTPREAWHGGQAAPGAIDTAPGACVECEADATLHCVQCQDDYCPVCYAALHRKGKRAAHTTTPVAPGGGASAGQVASRPDVGLVATDAKFRSPPSHFCRPCTAVWLYGLLGLQLVLSRGWTGQRRMVRGTLEAYSCAALDGRAQGPSLTAVRPQGV